MSRRNASGDLSSRSSTPPTTPAELGPIVRDRVAGSLRTEAIEMAIEGVGDVPVGEGRRSTGRSPGPEATRSITRTTAVGIPSEVGPQGHRPVRDATATNTVGLPAPCRKHCRGLEDPVAPNADTFRMGNPGLARAFARLARPTRRIESLSPDQKTVALVTGGASGIGLALAREIGTRVDTIVIADVDGASLETASEHLQDLDVAVHPHQVDLRNAQQVDELAAACRGLGAVTLACFNAGVVSSGQELWRTPEDTVRFVLDCNVVGATNSIRSIVPMLVEQSLPSAVVITASMAALVEGAPPRSL
jgi:hypothetical protein